MLWKAAYRGSNRMKDMILAWVEEHTGENADGTWSPIHDDFLEEKALRFPTETALYEWLWRYAMENPECYLPSIP